ncbi:DUF4333 domain-containing protein [Nocardia jejuensis]|uniref:DUF4333 domain-containing protein n=1 Tax=Nocardia jejuensis TaxID=328049 RepID=UPI00082F3613|nr:DUF4333 domain-containing protein [Nocardia jejuensis]
MSGPYGPNDAPGAGDGRNDPTQHWGGGQPAPGSADPTQQWGGQQPGQQAGQWNDPTQQQQPPQQWGQSQPQQPQQNWGQSQPQWPQPGQPQPGQPQPGQPEWGQQPQTGQQPWGQQSQPQWQQPGQTGPQDWNQQGQPQPGQPWPGQPAPKKKTGLIIGLAIGAVVVIGAIIAGVVFLTAKDQLDDKSVATGVQKVLKDSYGIEDVQDVSCPSGQKVEVDKTFDCTLKVGGEAKKVTIKITKDDGTYEVGRPS